MVVETPYERRYPLQKPQRAYESLRVTIPYELVVRAASEAGVTVDEFIETHQVVFRYGSPPGATITFEKR